MLTWLASGHCTSASADNVNINLFLTLKSISANVIQVNLVNSVRETLSAGCDITALACALPGRKVIGQSVLGVVD